MGNAIDRAFDDYVVAYFLKSVASDLAGSVIADEDGYGCLEVSYKKILKQAFDLAYSRGNLSGNEKVNDFANELNARLALYLRNEVCALGITHWKYQFGEDLSFVVYGSEKHDTGIAAWGNYRFVTEILKSYLHGGMAMTRGYLYAFSERY